MFAIIRTGGKQYRVAKDDKLEIEKLEAKDGDKVDFDVLFVSDGKTISTGEPLVKGASVKAKVLGQKRGPKITIFKKKRRKGYQKLNGFRASLTEIKITGIKAGGAKKATAEKPAAKAPAAKKPAAKKPAAKKPAAKKPAATKTKKTEE